MDENFLKFKKTVWLHILIKCIAAGVAAGFVTVLAVLLPCTLYGIKIFWLLYILIFIGGAAIGGGIAFLFLKTDDKKIAKRLDSEFKLRERVQTTLTYTGQSGDIYDLQRADTAAVLSSIPAPKLLFKNFVAFVLCCSISGVGIVAAPVIAATVPPVFAQSVEEPEDRPREITDWEWAALDELIDYVRASKKLDSFAKSGIVNQLEGLRSLLQSGVSQSTLPNFVQSTVIEIRNVVKAAEDNGISDEQKALNEEERDYVITKLYEIFSLNKPAEGGDENGEEESGGGGNAGGGESGLGPGSVNVNRMPFFDPDVANTKGADGKYQSGDVLCGESRAEYYQRMQQALKEGTISQQEWEYIMVMYFGDLSGNEEN